MDKSVNILLYVIIFLLVFWFVVIPVLGFVLAFLYSLTIV